MIHPEPMNYGQCMVLCPIIDAEIPQDHAMLKDAIQILTITQYKDGYFWVQTQQEAILKTDWTYEDAFNNQITLQNQIIYPNMHGSVVGLTKCIAHKKGKQIYPSEMGYIYTIGFKMENTI